MAFDLRPSSSTIAAVFSRPVSRRTALTSGEILGLVLPKVRQIAPSITMDMPRAVRGMESKIRYDTVAKAPPVRANPKPNRLYGFSVNLIGLFHNPMNTGLSIG